MYMLIQQMKTLTYHEEDCHQCYLRLLDKLYKMNATRSLLFVLVTLLLLVGAI